MLEIELKSPVPDEAASAARLMSAGAKLVFSGRIEDARYDTENHALLRRDVVLRLRVMRDDGAARATLDWKGPASYGGGYKRRDETSLAIADPAAMVRILEGLGLRVSREIDREVRIFEWAGATVRFERYPRMDTLVEVEGTPDAIERAIAVLGLPREGFTPDRLATYIARFESRTGQRAAICDREARGDYVYSLDDA